MTKYPYNLQKNPYNLQKNPYKLSASLQNTILV